MSKQFASLRKGVVYQLGDAEENGLQALIVGIAKNEDTYTPTIGLAQQTALGDLVFVSLPTSTVIHYRVSDGENVTNPPPILIAAQPVPWPPGSPIPEPLTTFAIGLLGTGKLYHISIYQIDVPGATFREYNTLGFSVTTPPAPN